MPLSECARRCVQQAFVAKIASRRKAEAIVAKACAKRGEKSDAKIGGKSAEKSGEAPALS
jgi:hypothetical protein